MTHLTYLILLAGCLVATAPLELVLHTRVYARWGRLVATVVPVAVVFTGWDLYAVHAHQWSYARGRVVAVLPGGLPPEEVLFFVVVPICAILTLEAVRRRRPDWRIGARR
jgi:lycopene cyclase domain-containing protein